MNDFTEDDAHRIIEAAADGRTVEPHEELGSVLRDLHAPGEVATGAPPLSVAGAGITGRVFRRTAVAASVAVLGLASMAAAATGGTAFLDPLIGDEGPEIANAAEETTTTEASTDDSDSSTTTTVTTTTESPEEEPEADPTEENTKSNKVDIDGVDPSDGLDETELAIACEAVRNHGQYVSMVARDKITETEGTHGERVSEAAKSDCGKPEAEEPEAEEPEEEPEVEEPEAEAPEAEKPSEKASPGQGKGHEKANGNGHEKAKGQGHAKHGGD